MLMTLLGFYCLSCCEFGYNFAIDNDLNTINSNNINSTIYLLPKKGLPSDDGTALFFLDNLPIEI